MIFSLLLTNWQEIIKRKFCCKNTSKNYFSLTWRSKNSFTSKNSIFLIKIIFIVDKYHKLNMMSIIYFVLTIQAFTNWLQVLKYTKCLQILRKCWESKSPDRFSLFPEDYTDAPSFSSMTSDQLAINFFLYTISTKKKDLLHCIFTLSSRTNLLNLVIHLSWFSILPFRTWKRPTFLSNKIWQF